jgi:hypothetical protein
MVTVDFSSSFSISLALENDLCVCASTHGQTTQPFDETVRRALLRAVNACKHMPSVPLATALALLSHLFWLARNVLVEPPLTLITVASGGERASHRDPVIAICDAFRFLVDPGHETCQSALVRFVYSFAPPQAALPPQRTALANMLAEAALTTFIEALQCASYFSVKQEEINGLVKIPRLRGLPLQWLSHNTGFLTVLRQLAATHLVAFRELVAVVVAVFGRSVPQDSTQDLVGAALDAVGGKKCRIADITAATRSWLGSSPFAPVVSRAELERLSRLGDDDLSFWVCGIRSPQSLFATFRLSSILPGPSRKRDASDAPTRDAKKVRFSSGDIGDIL